MDTKFITLPVFMKLIFLTILLISLHTSCAYDNFQGLAQLKGPCFPAYRHLGCTRTLWRVYNPLKGENVRNTPETKLFLFTPSSQDKAEQLHKCAGGLSPGSTFNTSCPTEIFIHGWIDGVCRTAWMREMKEQLFQRSSCYNVILVDWTWGNTPDLFVASLNSIAVGKQVAFVLKKIARQKKYDCKKFHIVGHSYGALAASYAGKNMNKECRLGRATLLDDAIVPYGLKPTGNEFINENDALLIDIIHTDIGVCAPFNLGDPRPLGQINFYVNDGTFQPSCYPYAVESIFKLDILYGIASFVYPALCPHLQAIQYYKASILAYKDNTQLIGVQCKNFTEWLTGKCDRNCEPEGNCLPLGMDTPTYIDPESFSRQDRKVYYVPTTLTCPYADHHGFKGLPLKPTIGNASLF